ncbi:MAG TPA: tetratricopeptide repeat protein [Flavobacteriales bacterium]|nr:tetratricopeptide repeat protein [Flavobacteriales bacterium]
MKKRVSILFLIQLHFFSGFLFSQHNETTLRKKILERKQDTATANACYTLGMMALNRESHDSALAWFKKGSELSFKINYKKGRLKNLYQVGRYYYNTADYARSIEYVFRSLKIAKEIKDTLLVAECYKTIASIYDGQSNFAKALEYNLNALKLYESIHFNEGISACYNNMGVVYNALGNHKKALGNFSKAAKIDKSRNDKAGLSRIYTNIGTTYYYVGNFDTALVYLQKSLTMAEELGDHKGMSSCYTNIGSIYGNRSNYKKALEYFTESLKIDEMLGDKLGMSKDYINIGLAYMNLKNFPKSKEYMMKAKELKFMIGDVRGQSLVFKALSEMYADWGNFREAYRNFIRYTTLNDSVFSADNTEQINQLKTASEVEKKETQMRHEQEKKEAVFKSEQAKKELELRNEKLVRNMLAVGALGLAALIFIIFRNLRQTKKANNIIARQKKEVEEKNHLVEEKQKEILDSINYAKRLQDAILPPQKFADELLPKNFIYYKPKDIVAGDFYFLEKKDDCIILAAADSTGHGVPGAMVSVVCSNALGRSVKEFGLTDPGKILEKTRELVIETFEKSTSEVLDGMDISIMSIHLKANKIQWSGANNPLWIVPPGATEVIEFRPDKQPIGKTSMEKPFTTHEYAYISGTNFYLFTDGFPDQFGGPEGKKFKHRQLKEVLVKLAPNQVNMQLAELDKVFNQWKGELDQIDDVCIIGIRL